MTKKTIPVIVPAAGIGSRFENDIPKQYFKLDTLTVIETTIRELLNSNIVERIIICVAENDKFIEQQDFYHDPKVKIIKGGSTRAQSVLNALNDPVMEDYDFVAVHDAARPSFSSKDLSSMYDKLINEKLDGIYPYIQLTDSLKSHQSGTVNKDEFYLAQTPQLCKKNSIHSALKNCLNNNIEVPDESFALEHSQFLVDKVQGQRNNIKITYKEDIDLIYKFLTRTGTGYDLHRYKEGKGILLGGHLIPCEYSIVAHSDGDVLLHSLADSILGASALGDIGMFFSDTDIANKGLDSSKIIEFCLLEIANMGFEIFNVDITIICESPKINPHRNQILKSLSKILKINENKIGLKATTSEKLGIIGSNQAIAVQTLTNLKKI